MGTRSAAAGQDDGAVGLALAYPNEPLELRGGFTQFGKNFDPALGFVDRTGIRQYEFLGAWRWHPVGSWLHEIGLEMRPLFLTDLSGRLVGEDHDVPTLNFKDAAGDALKLETTTYADRLDNPFEIRPGVVIPPGYYRYPQAKLEFAASPARPLSGSIELRAGDFYNGTQRQVTLSLDWRPSPHWLLGGSYDWREIRLPAGDFEVRVARLRVKLAFTPNLSLNTLAQYDNLSRQLGASARLKWTVRPGSDVFAVLNQGYEYDRSRLVLRTSESAAKGGWT